MKLFLLSLMLTYGLIATDAMDAAKKLGAENNYAEAIAKAQKEKKMLVMVIVKKNCRWCDKIVNQTLSDERVKKILEKDFITLIVDRNARFPSEFRENFFPSVFYIDYTTQKSVYENVGFVGTKCFLNDLAGALKTRNALYEQ